jgi:hypothetical protein
MKLMLEKGEGFAPLTLKDEQYLIVKTAKESFGQGSGSCRCTLSLGGGQSNKLHMYYTDEQGRAVPLKPAAEEEKLVQIFLPERELEIIAGAFPWYERPDLAAFSRRGAWRHFIYMPLYGWFNHQWYDGPLLHINRETQLWSLGAVGGRSRLIVDIDEVTSERKESSSPLSYQFLSENRLGDFDLDEKGSLIEAVRSSPAGVQLMQSAIRGVTLKLKDFSAWEAVVMAVVRLTWPDYFLYMTSPEKAREDWRYWRRLCRNLGVVFDTAHRHLAPDEELALEMLEPLIPAQLIGRVAQLFNKQGRLIIPPPLLGELGTVSVAEFANP